MGQNDIISEPNAGLPIKHDERWMGVILVKAGRLKPESVDRILRLQRETGLPFGEAATQLGLLNQSDIQFALSRQFAYPFLQAGQGKVSEDLVAAYEPFSPQVEALRALRSQLMLRWFDSDPAHKALAIIGAARHEGRSYIAANLAVVFSQLGARTLLIDANMRNPCQHKLFGLNNHIGLSAVLAGRAGAEAIQRVPALLDLSVLPVGAVPPNPLELLSRPMFARLLDDLARNFDVILLDSPAANEYADAQIIAVRAGATMIIVRKDAVRNWKLRGVSENVAQASATVVGVVYNDS